MSKLFNDLPEGCHHLSGYLNARDQSLCVALCRNLLKEYPLMQPTTKSGFPMALKVSSWGMAGWFGRDGVYSYIAGHDNGKLWSPIPKPIENFMNEALILAGFPRMDFHTVLLNWYPPGTGRLGKHRDITEDDHTSPIVTISLGDSAKFVIGGLEYEDKGKRIELRSGDVFVMGGPSRLIYHEVEKLIPSENPLFANGGRISLTGRRVFNAVPNNSI